MDFRRYTISCQWRPLTSTPKSWPSIWPTRSSSSATAPPPTCSRTGRPGPVAARLRRPGGGQRLPAAGAAGACARAPRRRGPAAHSPAGGGGSGQSRRLRRSWGRPAGGRRAGGSLRRVAARCLPGRHRHLRDHPGRRARAGPAAALRSARLRPMVRRVPAAAALVLTYLRQPSPSRPVPGTSRDRTGLTGRAPCWSWGRRPPTRVARSGPSSTAMTRQPRSASGSVAWPVPGPISRMREPGLIPVRSARS
jgi:hypothetical protein